MIKKAVIPAAGFATRFMPACKAQPKEMLPILDKPTLQYIVEEARDSGITDILLVIGRNKESIVNHFDRSVELEEHLKKANKESMIEELRKISDSVNIHYVRQKEQKGLGHAVLCAKAFVGNDPFAVILGDDIVKSDVPAIKQLAEIYNRFEAPVVGVQSVDQRSVNKYGIIAPKKVEDDLYRVEGMVEKPSAEEAPSDMAIMGRYIITPDIFELLENTAPGKGNEIQLTDALLALSKKRPLYATRFTGERYDVGDKIGFLKANIEFGLRDPGLRDELIDYLTNLDTDRF